MVWLTLTFASGCGAEPECTRTSECSAGRVCVNSRCLSPIGFDGGGADAGADAGRTDAGGRDGGARDAGPADAGARDAGATPDAGGTDAGVDAGPACECSGTTRSETRSCGVCGRETRSCDGCNWGAYGPCVDSDTRCGGNAPYCRNDYCWGWRSEHETGTTSPFCIDLGFDYAPGPEYGSLTFQIYGRPGAGWTKDNAHISCGSGTPYVAAESGTLDGAGRATNTFLYGSSLCDNGTLGRFESRVRIVDTGGRPGFTLPNTVITSFYNSTCTADRSSCGAVASLCL